LLRTNDVGQNRCAILRIAHDVGSEDRFTIKMSVAVIGSRQSGLAKKLCSFLNRKQAFSGKIQIGHFVS
jgi:hypothetical protein